MDRSISAMAGAKDAHARAIDRRQAGEIVPGLHTIAQRLAAVLLVIRHEDRPPVPGIAPVVHPEHH
jgi:hypothetical protein